MREDTDLRLGIEADFVPGREDRMASLLDARDWDYVVGSIHFVGDGALDDDRLRHLGARASRPTRSGDVLQWLGELARSGLFDILAHPDLVKHWGRSRPWPDGDLRRFYELAMDGIAESGIAIEVSTAGLRKPVGEIYPDRAFLEMCLDAGNPVALSSDAHVAEHARLGYDARAGAARRRGRAASCASFERRRAERRRGAARAADRPMRRRATGIGWDSHRLVAGRPLILGGVRDRARRSGSTATPTPTC